MGNALRFLCGSFQKPAATAEHQDFHEETEENVGVSALEQGQHQFHETFQAPPGLSQYVSSSKKAQASWYSSLLRKASLQLLILCRLVGKCSKLGNILRFLCGSFQKPAATAEHQDFHGETEENVGVSALEQDLHHFHETSQVPPGLSQYVSSSKKAQANWYNTLLKAWNEARPPPKQPEAAAKLVIQSLKNIKKANLEGFLAFYGLPCVPQTAEEDKVTPPWPEGVQFELRTLPIIEKAIGDGDGFIAYVSTKEPRELNLLPQEVKDAIKMREKARAAKNFAQAKLINKEVIAAGYRFIKLPKEPEILAHKYRIRLRGVDAPEGEMPYGEEAKQMLVKLIQGKPLKIHVYGEDQFGRYVGDVYCDDIFIQEQLLKRGCVWHFAAYDRRPKFAMWENEARADRRGLWALPDPEKPWVWRKNNPNPHEH